MAKLLLIRHFTLVQKHFPNHFIKSLGIQGRHQLFEDISERLEILDTWTDYYAKAMDSIKDLVSADDEKTLRKITMAKEAIKAQVPEL